MNKHNKTETVSQVQTVNKWLSLGRDWGEERNKLGQLRRYTLPVVK